MVPWATMAGGLPSGGETLRPIATQAIKNATGESLEFYQELSIPSDSDAADIAAAIVATYCVK